MAISHLMVLFYSRNRHNVTLFLTITPLYLTVTLFLFLVLSHNYTVTLDYCNSSLLQNLNSKIHDEDPWALS